MRNEESRSEDTDVLIVGAGAAGLRAAIAAHDAGRRVVVLGKRRRKDAHTVLASGGINASLGNVDPEDSWQQHLADTLIEGYFLGDPRAVELLVREAPEGVLELADWGCDFARLDDGTLDQRYFGAHRYRRTCYAGDFTGRAVLDTLDAQAERRGIRIVENAYVSRLLVRERRCFGALSFDLQSGLRTVTFARSVVLATGGYTRLWRRSSSRRDENNGDGIVLALEAGCSVADLELVQFHPTGMVAPEDAAGTLVTEAMRGEGARLFNAEGERFMERYDPERLELSSRDRVALAIYTEITEGRGTPNGGVFLDITHRSKSDIVEQLPRMFRQFREIQGIDISKERVEVAPTAHYSMGGVVVDPETHGTEVDGLYAAGEVTSGVHGANRLGGNSLIETIVFGRRAGEAAAAYAEGDGAMIRDRPTARSAMDALDRHIRRGELYVRPVQRALRDVMWERAGVVRSAESLSEGLARVEEISRSLARIDVWPGAEGYDELAHVLDLRASVVVAEATLRSALERRESRGAHSRADFPDVDPSFRFRLVVRRDEDGELKLERAAIPAIPDALVRWIDESPAYEAEGRLLE